NHLQLSTLFAGAVGFKVCDLSDRNVVGYLSNNHIAAAGPTACEKGAPLGTPQFQPGTWDSMSGRQIRTLERFVPLVSGSDNYNYADIAFVRSSNDWVSDTILGVGLQTSTPRIPLINETVRKSGPLTGVTNGRVFSYNWTGYISLQCGIYRFARLLVVTSINGPAQGPPFGYQGDSGSPVVDAMNNPLGIFTASDGAGTGLVATMVEMTSRLNVTLECSSQAAFESQTVPNPMTVGQSYPVSLTFRNVGATQWVPGTYWLRSRLPPDNMRWGVNRVPLPYSVPRNGSVTFNFTVTAPATPGNYLFAWELYQNGSGPIPTPSADLSITVGHQL